MPLVQAARTRSPRRRIAGKKKSHRSGTSAVFAPLAQDDFTESSGFHGHMAGLNYKLTDKAGLLLCGLISNRDDPSQTDRTSYRIRLDFNVRF